VNNTRNNYLKKKYGITLEDFEQMLKNQGGVCKICKSPPTKHNLCVDHDHKSKEMKIRGLLCTKCNYRLGMIKDDLQFLTSAAIYLEEAHNEHRNT
jgi:hypothetical protein